MSGVTLRDLTRAMKAAKAAGIVSFELVDPATGLIFRARSESEFVPEDDLDIELKRFEARRNG